MPAVAKVRVPLQTGDRAGRAHLQIAVLPRMVSAGPAPLLDERGAPSLDATVAEIQLLEGQEYLYEWEGLSELSKLVTDPAEVFQPDTSDGLRGRLRPGLWTGALNVVARCGDQSVGQLELEVRSRKLEYRSEYRWMLKDIADRMTELLMNRFAASETSFQLDDTRDAITLYQRFAFLRALITSESFQLALAEIARRPHVAWEDRHETVRPGAALKADAYTVRQLSRPGPRTPWPGGAIPSMPVQLDRRRTEATHDTTSNRFVKFALERWRQVLGDIEMGLLPDSQDPAIARGRREIAQVMGQLDEVLHQDLFRELGPLARFPADDQVLHRREGYRDVFRAYVEFELAARLSWKRSETDYGAGQRDVATLYEYWAFIQLATLVAELVGKTFDLMPLIETRSDGLNVVLQTGRETVLSGVVERLGRKMFVEMCFNRTFGRGQSELTSWTRPMRPDYSIIIRSLADESAAFEPVILHFDAKYRVSFITELFGQPDELPDSDDPVSTAVGVKRGGALRADLLKMHAYRDAIRRSSGAYVLYPGDEDQWKQNPFCEYHELLPGLGAFVLRPTRDGTAIGTGALRVFLDQVFDHVATRLTQHERGRYWLEEVYGGQAYATYKAAADLADSPPSPETSVLLGYVKSVQHWDWIQQRRTYNVRTEGRPGGVAANADLLYSQLLVLYCPETRNVALARIVSAPELVSKLAMNNTGYPDPKSDYLCVEVSWVRSQQWVNGIQAEEIDRYVQRQGKARGTPTAVQWADLSQMRPF